MSSGLLTAWLCWLFHVAGVNAFQLAALGMGTALKRTRCSTRKNLITLMRKEVESEDHYCTCNAYYVTEKQHLPWLLGLLKSRCRQRMIAPTCEEAVAWGAEGTGSAARSIAPVHSLCSLTGFAAKEREAMCQKVPTLEVVLGGLLLEGIRLAFGLHITELWNCRGNQHKNKKTFFSCSFCCKDNTCGK